MPSSRGEPSRDRIPDPTALAQGHRLWRAAGKLELAGFLGGLLGLPWIQSMALWIVLPLALAWLRWGQRTTILTRARAARGLRLPAEIQGLLRLVDGLADMLERGKDRQFNLDVPELCLVLDDLGPEAQRYLDERGIDRGRLRHGVCEFDPEARSLWADRRRALHGELLRFAAAARGRPCGDPYRSPRSDGPTLLFAVREPVIARSRRRLGALLLLVGVGWVLVSQMTAVALLALLQRACDRDHPYRYCTLDASDLERAIERTLLELARCDLGLALERFDALRAQVHPHMEIVIALALMPMFLLVTASVIRGAAQRSWASALPQPLQASGDFPSIPAGPLVRARRRQRAVRRLWRGLAWLTCAFTCGLLLATDWKIRGSAIELVIAIEFVTLVIIAILAMMTRLEHGREWRWLQSRVERAPGSTGLLTELFELRRELVLAAPVRADLLEQLADALEQADVLNRLSTADRDRVVARLRAAAARAPAIGRELRAELLLDVCACEELISREIKPANQGWSAA